MTEYTMNKNFDLDSVGKRLPYSAPDGHLDHFEDDVFARIHRNTTETTEITEAAKTTEAHTPRHRTPRLGTAKKWVAAAAAAAAIVLSVTAIRPTPQTTTASDVETAFCQLSADDQAFLLSVYQDDVFLNEDTSAESNQY